jgi:hypothetical protein
VVKNKNQGKGIPKQIRILKAQVASIQQQINDLEGGVQGPQGPAGPAGGNDSADGVQITSVVFTGNGIDIGTGFAVEIVINGTGFTTCSASCGLTFNSSPVTIDSSTGTEIKAHVPLLTAGMYQLAFSNGSGDSDFIATIPSMVGAFNVSKTISGDFRAGFPSVLVGCPLGSALLSGGYSTDPNNDLATIVVLANEPFEEDTWHVGGFTEPFNNAVIPSPSTIKVTARCMWFGQAGNAVPDPTVP